MESRLKVLGHPVHPMLVMFPLALLTTGALFDLADAVGGPRVLGEVGYWNITIGLVGGLLAAVAGTFDLLAIPTGTRAKRVAVAHALINVGVIALFAGVWVVRTGAEGRGAGGALIAIELVALAGLGVAAWFGGELVDRLGVGVDEDAHLNASSSLRPQPAGHPGGQGQAGRAGRSTVDRFDPIRPDAADPAADRELHHPDTGLR